MFGISAFTAVINPPQSCILAVGSGVSRVLPPTDKNGKPKVSTLATVQLSGDRRVVDEATASKFLWVSGYELLFAMFNFVCRRLFRNT